MARSQGACEHRYVSGQRLYTYVPMHRYTLSMCTHMYMCIQKSLLSTTHPLPFFDTVSQQPVTHQGSVSPGHLLGSVFPLLSMLPHLDFSKCGFRDQTYVLAMGCQARGPLLGSLLINTSATTNPRRTSSEGNSTLAMVDGYSIRAAGAGMLV